MNELGLESFLQAAQLGMLVWVQDSDGVPTVLSGDRPSASARPDVGSLLAVALREHYGEAASGVVECEFGLGERRQRSLPARTILRAVESAESTLSLLMAQATMLRFEFSAEFVGRRFRQLCRELSISVPALSLERRRAMDEAMVACFTTSQPPSAEVVRHQLTILLTQGLH